MYHLCPHYMNFQNSKISFWYVKFYTKIFLVLHSLLENSTTRIPQCQYLKYKVEEASCFTKKEIRERRLGFLTQLVEFIHEVSFFFFAAVLSQKCLVWMFPQYSQKQSVPDLYVVTVAFLALKELVFFHFFGPKKKISKIFFIKLLCNFSVRTL